MNLPTNTVQKGTKSAAGTKPGTKKEEEKTRKKKGRKKQSHACNQYSTKKITTAGGEAMSRPGSGDIDSISSSKSKENTRQKAADSSKKSEEFSLFLLNL